MEEKPATAAFYARQSSMTSPGRHEHLFANLPSSPDALAAIAQGLLIHEFLVDFYGVTLADEDRDSLHIRSVEGLLGRIVDTVDAPLSQPRPPANRVAANCRHFTLLMVSMLRAQGTPARARCGFGTYFQDGFFEDHWVCEYWRADVGRWVLIDAQIDEIQRRKFAIDFDLGGVPRDRFLTAGDAWKRFRSGAADANTFGLSLARMAGDWWIAGNLLRDAAALLGTELLPWDCWGAMPRPEEPIDAQSLQLFDHLAELTTSPDQSFDELRQLGQDDRLKVPAQVYNAVRDRRETI